MKLINYKVSKHVIGVPCGFSVPCVFYITWNVMLNCGKIN